MKLTVEVVQADIDNGIRGECESCPVAIAVYRALVAAHPEHAELIPHVEGEIAHLFDRTDMLAFTAVNPEEVLQFISDFDEFKPVQPFTVELDFQED